MATLSDDPRQAAAQAQRDARALEAAKLFQASQDRRPIEGLGYLLPVDFPMKESGAVDFSGARPAVPQIIKDVANFVTQTGAGAMGKAPPMAPEDLAMGMLDFTGAGILASAPARIAAKQAGDTMLGTAGGTTGPFGINPPLKNKRDILNYSKASRDLVPIPSNKVPDYSPVFNALEDPTTLGFSTKSPNKPTLTGEQIFARLKNQPSVSMDELEYMDLENFLLKPENKNRKFSQSEMKNIVFQRQPQISVLESNRSLEAMDQQDFDLTYSGDQRIVDETSDREYKEYVFQDSRPIVSRGKDLSDDQIEKLIDADASIVNYTREFTHYPDIDNTIGHARVSVIDNPKDPSLNATVIEEIQPDLVQAGVPRKELEGKSLLDSKSKEYATPGKVEAGLAIGLDPRNLVKQPPFKTTTSASRYFMQNVIQKSLNDGVDTVILPDYEDLARVHGSDSVKSFKQNYTDVFNKIISDYKNQGIKVETGVIKPDELNEIQIFSNAVKPMKYVTFLEPEQIKKAAIRRYNKGGQVNVRSGIGAMARTHM